MNAILELLKKINPGIANNKLFKIIEYVVLALLLYGLYADATGSLNTAKEGRDQQLLGIEAQIGFTNSTVYEMKDEIEQVRAWNKSISERNKVLETRIHRLEDRALRGR